MSTLTTDHGEEAAVDVPDGEAAEQHLVDVLNHGALALMLSIGHRTGLLDALARRGPVTPVQLAEGAGCTTRYVTEWLGALTVGRVVAHDPNAGTYRLPDAYAALLTRDGDENLAAFAQYLPQLGGVEDRIVACFHHGGGVDYAAYDRFHEIMEEDSAQTVLPALRDHILPLVPGLLDRLERGIQVLDVGCGRGRAINDLATWFPNSGFVGVDLSPDAVGYARTTAERRGLDNVTFHVQDATHLDQVVDASSVDLALTFDAVHDQAHPLTVVAHLRRALTADGVYLAQDIDASSTHHGDLDHPLGTLLYTVSCLHCMTVSLARGGDGLGAMWGRERAVALFTDAGFREVTIHTLPHDPQNAYYVCRP